LDGGDKTNKKTSAIWVTTLVIAVLCSAFVTYKLTPFLQHKDPKLVANVYFYEGTGAGAKLISKSGNLITDIGENVTLFSLNAANQTLVAISTGNASSITADLTQLDTEATTLGFDRVAANVSAYWFNSGDIAINYTALFRATDTISVNSVGLHWSVTDDSDNNMYAASFITDGTDHQFPVDGELTAVWVITANAN
jgi:hypothetical protein